LPASPRIVICGSRKFRDPLTASAAIVTRIAEDGISERLKYIADAIGNDDRTREECFALATLFVLFDGEVGDEEQEFLSELQRVLHVSDDRASHITSLLADSD
jgi:hypothetical protein